MYTRVVHSGKRKNRGSPKYYSCLNRKTETTQTLELPKYMATFLMMRCANRSYDTLFSKASPKLVKQTVKVSLLLKTLCKEIRLILYWWVLYIRWNLRFVLLTTATLVYCRVQRSEVCIQDSWWYSTRKIKSKHYLPFDYVSEILVQCLGWKYIVK